MNDLVQPPAERDMPPGRAARMRAGLMRSTARPFPARRRTAVLAAATAAIVAVVAAVAGVAVTRSAGLPGEVVAMGAGEMSSPLRRATAQCLKWNRDPAMHTRPMTESDVAVATAKDRRAAIVFLDDEGYIACDIEFGSTWREPGGGINSFDPWVSRDWLPGPVEPLSMSSAQLDGGDVMLTGRASARVHRLVLEHGDGHTTEARLKDGAFGLISAGTDVTPTAKLVSYDAGGREIDRRGIFRHYRQYDHCWTGPSGVVLYPGPAPCRPAEQWGR